MPQAQQGLVITDSAQIVPGVVNSGDIANGAIVNEDVNASAAIAFSKLAGVAALGANSDITSLGGLTTPLSVAQGGQGAASLADGGVLVGSGVNAITVLALGTAGQVLTSNGAGSDPSMQASSGDLVVFVNAGGMLLVGGAVEKELNGNFPGFSGVAFDPGATEGAHMTIKVPAGATGLSSIKILHQFNAASGNVVLDLDASRAPIAGGAMAQDSEQATYAAGGTTDHLGIITVNAAVFNGLSTIAEHDLIGFEIRRIGADGSDSLTTDWDVLGVQFTFSV